MSLMTLLTAVVIPALTAIYTWNYARWAWKQKLKRGAIGLALLSLATLGFPLYAALFRS